MKSPPMSDEVHDWLGIMCGREMPAHHFTLPAVAPFNFPKSYIAGVAITTL